MSRLREEDPVRFTCNIRPGPPDEPSGPERSCAQMIRRALDEDAARIAAVLYESFVEFEDLYTPRAFAATVLSPQGVLERMAEGPLWVGLRGDVIVATASAVDTSTGVYIRGMGAVPGARGRGMGRLLLEHIEGFARERGAKRMYLSTTPFLGRAIRLYENYGFDPTADPPTDLYGTPLFTMVKTIDNGPVTNKEREGRK